MHFRSFVSEKYSHRITFLGREKIENLYLYAYLKEWIRASIAMAQILSCNVLNFFQFSLLQICQKTREIFQNDVKTFFIYSMVFNIFKTHAEQRVNENSALE